MSTLSDIDAGLLILDRVISLLKSLMGQHGLDGDALGVIADSKDLANAAAIKKMLAEPPGA